ncbi:membrane associated protein Pal1 [Schizosaccharomyces cryophilus OY26]|uniref:Membrane associated protein Pal1 n=1 Tax=Schizosaccharomyces cryophilus (strain OY26 / ATCC MYA-4695 / CBS 11777 / NBRC 106824 / NRRL Y48691) TaxID=653667 RepID=S9VQ45_SCHCR|nr:membrane associated protein Pal1 [Schizosaccharomyces cryophilus OY26]EPY50083.1 membrane associated protein Pal1 [Schizosaccharomyces cryophilus OY26]
MMATENPFLRNANLGQSSTQESPVDPSNMETYNSKNPFLSPNLVRTNDPYMESLADDLFSSLQKKPVRSPISTTSSSPVKTSHDLLDFRPHSSMSTTRPPSSMSADRPPSYRLSRARSTHVGSSSGHYRSPSNEYSPSIQSGNSRAKGKIRRHKTVREGQRNKNFTKEPLDQIDRLDVTGIYGSGSFHHDGPFDACRPHRNRNVKKAPVAAFPKDSVANSIPKVGSNFNDPSAPKDFSRKAIHDTLRTKKILQSPFSTMSYDEDDPIPAGTSEAPGLTDSTRIEGALASKSAIARNEEIQAMERAGLRRKNSLMRKLNLGRSGNLSRSSTLPSNYRSRSALEVRKSPITSPRALNPISNANEYDSDDSISQSRSHETKPSSNKAPPPPKRRNGGLNTRPYPAHTQSQTSLPLTAKEQSKPKKMNLFRRLFSRRKS